MRGTHDKTETQPLGTVKDNMIGHTEQQKERAKEARKSCHVMGAATIRNFKHIIKSNQTSDCPVTLEDIDGAEKIHRKDILCIKGKTTRWNPTTTTIMNIAMPKELKEQNTNIMSCMDIMCINKIGFVINISHPLCCWGCQHMENNTKDSFCGSLNKSLQVCNNGDIASSTSNVTINSRVLWMRLMMN